MSAGRRVGPPFRAVRKKCFNERREAGQSAPSVRADTTKVNAAAAKPAAATMIASGCRSLVTATAMTTSQTRQIKHADVQRLGRRRRLRLVLGPSPYCHVVSSTAPPDEIPHPIRIGTGDLRSGSGSASGCSETSPGLSRARRPSVKVLFPTQRSVTAGPQPLRPDSRFIRSSSRPVPPRAARW